MNSKKTFIGLCISSIIIFVLFIFIYVFVIIGWDVFSTRSERSLWHKKTHEFIETLDRNTTREKVFASLSRPEWQGARVIEQDSKIIVLTPIEFGAGNWIIELLFDAIKIKSVHVRTEDDPKFKLPPSGAPRDILFITQNNEK